MRLILFSSGIPILLQPIFSTLLPSFIGINIIIQLACNCLLLLAIVQIRKEHL
jgi:hypothetical protein